VIDNTYIQFTSESRITVVSNGKPIQIIFMNGMKNRKRNKKENVIIVNYLGILRISIEDTLEMVEEDCISKLIEKNTINHILLVTVS